ncbi:Ger(x)C family spore germination protein [Tumebacillus flagellatus]|uniref:Uncharacterized protein n=1 Tax=Tumebacillus flagellatus TaxID=1157490 RepID=A0A074LPV0_9BACL|nr:Ger(x)C family spore germination protein [Tumebacillus flagellatus]KEO82525.1 hypothetical protein EL26_14925 [Tumebacillus flagellatus]
MRGRRARAWMAVSLILVLFSLLLTGCWDNRELEERTSVVALAVDREQSQDTDAKMVKVAVQIPIPIKIAGSGGGSAGEGGKNAVKVMSATGESMADALRQLQQQLNQELFYGHTRVIAVSQDIAEEDMAGIIDAIRRTPQMRRLLWLLVTPGPAVDLLNSDPKLEQIPIVYVMDLIENGSKQGRIPDITLGHWFIDRSSTGVEPIANLIEPDKQDVKWEGLAMFHDDKMVGTLNEQESWVLMNLREEQTGGNITIVSPIIPKKKNHTDYITVHPKKVHTKTRVTPDGDTFRMTAQVELEVDVIESMGALNFTDEVTFRSVEKALTDEMNKRAKHLVEKVQKQYKVDVFSLGDKVRARCYDRFEQIPNWSEVFPKTKIDVKYSVLIRRVGMKMH